MSSSSSPSSTTLSSSSSSPSAPPVSSKCRNGGGGGNKGHNKVHQHQQHHHHNGDGGGVVVCPSDANPDSLSADLKTKLSLQESTTTTPMTPCNQSSSPSVTVSNGLTPTSASASASPCPSSPRLRDCNGARKKTTRKREEDEIVPTADAASHPPSSAAAAAISPVISSVQQQQQQADSRTHIPDDGDSEVSYVVYKSELQMPDIMRLIQKDLSEPYSIYTYRYFIHNWPDLCIMARANDECVGAIVCKLDYHKKVVKRGYIAMLAVDGRFRKRKIGSSLVKKAIDAMIAQEADEVVLETEITNKPALRLYENLGFVRDKRLFRYYLNGVDALRLKLWFR